MKRSLTIDDHRKFHLTVLRTVMAGGLLGLLHGWFAPAANYLANPAGLHGFGAWLFGAGMVALLGGAAVLPTSRRAAATLLGCALLGGLGSGLSHLMSARTGCPALGQVGVAAALGLYLASGGISRLQALLGGLLGAAMAFASQRIPSALMMQDFMLELPNTAASLIGGLGMGLAVGSATIVRHLKVKLEPVDKELKGLIPPVAADDEISKLIAQAMTSYQQAAECLDEHPQARATAEQLIKKIARFGKKWQDIETQAHKSDRGKLDERIAELTARRDASSDESVRTEYERALAALREQVTSLTEIEKGRERAVARLHHQVATLDRLRLAALRHRSVGAARFGEELKSVVDELVQAGQELDTAAEVLAEVPS
jgi:hypothetical protein